MFPDILRFVFVFVSDVCSYCREARRRWCWCIQSNSQLSTAAVLHARCELEARRLAGVPSPGFYFLRFCVGTTFTFLVVRYDFFSHENPKHQCPPADDVKETSENAIVIIKIYETMTYLVLIYQDDPQTMDGATMNMR